MKIVCAWCGGEMGEKDGEGVDGASHTMCQGCFDRFALVVDTKEIGTDDNDTSGNEVKNSEKEGYDGKKRDGCGVREY